MIYWKAEKQTKRITFYSLRGFHKEKEKKEKRFRFADLITEFESEHTALIWKHAFAHLQDDIEEAFASCIPRTCPWILNSSNWQCQKRDSNHHLNTSTSMNLKKIHKQVPNPYISSGYSFLFPSSSSPTTIYFFGIEYFCKAGRRWKHTRYNHLKRVKG